MVTTGPAVDPASLRPAANDEVHRFVPHADLMPQVSLVVGHGGHGTTMQALAHDLPLVVMPMHPMLDQPMVGRLGRAGRRRTVVSKKATADELAPVIAGCSPTGRTARRPPVWARAIRAMPGATNGGRPGRGGAQRRSMRAPGRRAARP